MIDSEVKRNRIKGIIEQWALHTKVLPQLREYDIPGLVGQIIEEFYHTHLSCGHLANSIDDGVVLAFYEYEDTARGEVYGTYCKDCAEEYKLELGAWEVNVNNPS